MLECFAALAGKFLLQAAVFTHVKGHFELELELELIQTHMAQKPMLRVEVDARVQRGRSSKGASAVSKALAGSA